MCGIAVHKAFGTIVGKIGEVALNKSDGRADRRLHRLRHAVNPVNVEMQIESAAFYGRTVALFGEITIKKPCRTEQF